MKDRCILLAVLCAGAVSCTLLPVREEALREVPIEISAGSRVTKAAVDGVVIPEDYTIYLSSYFNNGTYEKESGNYLYEVPFRQKLNGKWSADPAVYWPMGGDMDFLAVCCVARDYSITDGASWYSENYTKGVELNVADGAVRSSEIMYAAANGKDSEDGSVALEFIHTQSWLQFQLGQFSVNEVRLDSIVLMNAYTGGKVRIQNDVFLSHDWDFRGRFRKSVVVPGTQDLVLSRESTAYCNILVPEQQACRIGVYWKERSSSLVSWDSCRQQVSISDANFDPWYSGVKTVFQLVKSDIPQRFVFEVRTVDWGNNEIVLN